MQILGAPDQTMARKVDNNRTFIISNMILNEKVLLDPKYITPLETLSMRPLYVKS